MDGKNSGRIFVGHAFLGSHTSKTVTKQVCMWALLKTRKASKDQHKDICMFHALQISCSKTIEKAQGNFRVLL